MALSQEFQKTIVTGSFVLVNCRKWHSTRQWKVTNVARKYFWAAEPLFKESDGSIFYGKPVKFPMDGSFATNGRSKSKRLFYEAYDSMEAFQDYVQAKAEKLFGI